MNYKKSDVNLFLIIESSSSYLDFMRFGACLLPVSSDLLIIVQITLGYVGRDVNRMIESVTFST